MMTGRKEAKNSRSLKRSLRRERKTNEDSGIVKEKSTKTKIFLEKREKQRLVKKEEKIVEEI